MEKPIENEIYDALEYANNYKLGVLIGQKIIIATKANDVEEVKRLISLPLNEGGLVLLRLIQHDKDGKSALQIAMEIKSEALIQIFSSE